MARRIHPDHHDHHRNVPVHQDGDGERPLRSHIERVQSGQDPTDAINRLYSFGRHHPYAKPHDAPRESTRHSRPTSPSHDDCYADYNPIKNSPVSPAPDESQPQFRDSKASTLNDSYGWVRGYGREAPYPKFDSGPSGHRYDSKHRR
jgi:hypothetical protein